MVTMCFITGLQAQFSLRSDENIWKKSRFDNKIFIEFSCVFASLFKKNNLWRMYSVCWGIKLKISLGHKQISQLYVLSTIPPEMMYAKRVSVARLHVTERRRRAKRAEFNYKHSINLLNALLRFKHHSHLWHFIFKTREKKTRQICFLHFTIRSFAAYGTTNISASS